MLRTILLFVGVFALVSPRAAEADSAIPMPEVSAVEDATFAPANKYFHEQSQARACDGFTQYLDHNPRGVLVREARVKRARACLALGRESARSLADLKAVASESDVDLAAGLANLTLNDRGEMYLANSPAGRLGLALDQLALVAKSSGGRWAKEARRFAYVATIGAMANQSYNPPAVEALASRVLSLDLSPEERDHVLFERAKTWLRAEKSRARAEKELGQVGDGNTEWADDAVYALAESFEQRQQYERALTLFDSIVKRFSPTTSNVFANAQSRAKEIRRPYVTVSVSYLELPGARPHAVISFRNLQETRIALRRHDPLAQDPHREHEGGDGSLAGAPRELVKTWSQALKAPSPYAPGTLELDLDVNKPGVYVLEVSSGEYHGVAMALVTPLASVLKISKNSVWIWTVDAQTGRATPGAEVAVYASLYDRAKGDRRYQVKLAQSDAQGLAHVDLSGGVLEDAIAWSCKDGGCAYARTSSNSNSDGNKEVLSYVLTDRPLYKPAETVGVKVFLRARQGGPTVPVPDTEVELMTYDPQSREVDRRTMKTSRFGTADFELKLKKDAALGAYRFQLDGKTVSINIQSEAGFRVEEYKPPEYTVTVEPLGKPKPNTPVKVKVNASFFFGGPVANAQGRAIVTGSGWAHQWTPWADDVTDNPSGYDNREYSRGRRDYSGYNYYGQLGRQTLTFKTGADGTAELSIAPTPGEGLPTDRSYQVQVFITDASRREVTGSGTANVSASPLFVDLRADRVLYKPGEQMELKLRAEDANKRPESTQVEVRLVKLGENGATSEILRRPALIQAGSGSVKLDADAVGPVRIEVVSVGAKEGEPALASADVWLTGSDKPIFPAQPGFFIVTDHAPLAVGRTFRALVVSPSAGGQALVSLEGEEINSLVVVEMKGRARFVELPLTAAMTPNVWFSVERIENLAQFRNQAPVHVAGSDTTVDVAVQYPKNTSEPGTSMPASVTIRGKGGAVLPAETTVSVVDESIFAIEPERTDFLTFFGRRPQDERVATSTSFDQKLFNPQRRRPSPNPDVAADATKDVLRRGPARSAPAAGAGAAMNDRAPPELSEKKELSSNNKTQAIARVQSAPASPKADKAGEDRDATGAPPVKVRSNFSSSAGWFAALQGMAPGAVRTPVSFPDSLTSWRTIATVVTTRAPMGVGRATTRTEKPLMVRLQAPRFFTERDEVTISAIVTSRLPKAAVVNIDFSAPGLKPLSGSTATITVSPGADARVDKRFVVIDTGDRKIRVTARTPGAADAMEWTLPSVVHGSAQRQFFAGQLQATQKLEITLPEHRNPAGTRFELTVSPSLLAVMLDSLPYLAQYPYGCVEQTLSRFVPAAIAAKAVHKLGVPATRIPPDLDDMVDAGLKRLYGFQHADGGWGWWQADATNRWMSAYAVYGLFLARDAGLSVDGSVLERGRAYLKTHLGAALDRPEEHAFMTFALAETGGAPKAALDKAFEHRSKLSRRGRALLSLALEASRDSRARIAIENLDDIITAAQGRTDASAGEANTSWQTSEAIEASAYTLMAIYRHDPASPLVKPLTDFLVLRRNGGKWRNTRDTAFAVYALSEIAMGEASVQSQGSLTVLVNGARAGSVSYSRGGVDITGPIVLADGAFHAGTNTVELRRDGGGTGYFAATWDVYNQDENLKAVGGDVTVRRTYTLLGKPSHELGAASVEYGMPLESGSRVRVDLEVRANKAVEYVMVEDLKAAGLEAVMQRSGPEVCAYACAHAELRPDRVAMFITELPVGITKLSYELRAEVPGKFHALPSRVEAMYAPEIRATSDEMRVEVRDAVDPGNGVAAQH